MNVTKNNLTARCEIAIRFNEADPMGIVWHGHYIQYFEDAREAFGAKYGISYSNVADYGFSLPVVSISCEYKRSLKYNDKAIVEIVFIDCIAPKIEFDYKIFRVSDSLLAATGKSTQVLLNSKGELQLFNPDFLTKWKSQNGLL